ncbi:hypothetical protein CHS0354_026104 [Potamilus streckersoni]|uniref:Ig-like domain-containing protein n=1 Tax=Potamilus streckersoni TaxID=2493646 RepID=A0AAE0S1K9_9BIVA|nr:hypothetical protein CHS0354_026104 [Potamilus streckersoni]
MERLFSVSAYWILINSLTINFIIRNSYGALLSISPSTPDGKLIVVEGSTLTLNCTFNSSSLAKEDVIFKRDGLNLNYEPGYIVSYSSFRENGHIITHLTATKSIVTCSDNGYYECTIESRKIATSVQVAVVKVLTRDAWISDKSKNISLGCLPHMCGSKNTTNGFNGRYFHVSWSTNGTKVKSGTKYHIHPEMNKITISEAEAADLGEFKCNISLTEREKKLWETSKTVYLRGPPRLNKWDNDKSVCLNDNVTLKCEASGYPLPHLEWRKNGKDLQANGTKLRFMPEGLQINSFTAEDEGEYDCIATSDFSIETDEAYINVKLKDEAKCKEQFSEHPKVSVIVGAILGIIIMNLFFYGVVVFLVVRHKRRTDKKRSGNLNIEYTAVKA